MDINTNTTIDPTHMYDNLNGYLLNPPVFIILAVIIIFYVVLFSSLGNNDSSSGLNEDNNGRNTAFNLMLLFFIFLIIINGVQYFFTSDITASIKGLFTPHTEVDIVVNENKNQEPIPEIKFKKQVFNVPGNYYNYENANALCKAYGSELATYKQVENAYNNGAEWCNYGWSAEQMALFPTQQNTYNNLQKIEGHEHDCGRPGINGGYMANPQLKFGVNCYGYKPKITQEENQLMKVESPYPKTEKDIAFQKRVDYWKNNINDILVSPFNYNRWGEIL
jgi:hypothetical protein